MLDRRDLLKALAAATPSVLGIGAVGRAMAQDAAEAELIATHVCRLTPETTEGPFYFDPRLLRSDIREDKPGHPLAMRLQVVDSACRPIEGARVDVWHCDAQGNYSGYPGQAEGDLSGQTFLRGSQVTNQAGRVAFRTIWPGWYRGRTTHVHFKVLLDQRTLVTGQMFFPDRFSRAVFQQLPAYARRSTRGQIFNGRDGIARRAGEGAFAQVTQVQGGFEAALVIGVARTRAEGTGPPPGTSGAPRRG